jgi:hypothetical protein
VIKLRRMRWVGHVACVGGRGYRFSVGKPEGKRPLRRPWHRWEDVLKFILKKQDRRTWTKSDLAVNRDK